MPAISTVTTGDVGGVLLSITPNSHVYVNGSLVDTQKSQGPAPHPCPCNTLGTLPPTSITEAASTLPAARHVSIKGKPILLAGDNATCGCHTIAGGDSLVNVTD